MDKCCKVAALYVATIRALAVIHQNAHWLSKGDNFYGEHLLFERIYDSALENMDSAAEKFIGVFGEECLDLSLQIELLNKVLVKYNKPEEDLTTRSLSLEKEFLKFSKDAYNCFEQEGKLTLGLDDLIMSIASKREEAVYLLQQSCEKDEK